MWSCALGGGMDLDGMRIVDLTRLLPGPYATQLLADMGADVVKVEDPDGGDYARTNEPSTPDGVGAVFDAVNRGKRSVAIDLTEPAGRELCYRLVETADAVVESFRPGVVDRLGVDHDTLAEENPELVYCSLTGYGQTGPDADRAGHDLNYVGAAGMLDLTRRSAGERPTIPGFPVADMAGGLVAALGVVSALLARERGGGGEYVDVAMGDAVLSLGTAMAAYAFAGEPPVPGHSTLTGGVPWYDVYATSDDEYVTLAALEPKFWAGFCRAVDRPDLLDAHGTADPDRRAALREELRELFRSRDREAWESLLEEADTAFAPVRSIEAAVEHPQFRSRPVVDERGDGHPRVGLPLDFAGDRPSTDGPPPGHGEHTREVLDELGVTEAERRELADEGVLG